MTPSVPSTRTFRAVGVWCVFLSAWGTVGYALFAYALRPLGSVVHPDMQAVFTEHRVAILAHISGSAVALALGPSQFMPRLRARRPTLHRRLGTAYLAVGVGVGGLSGLFMGTHAFGGTVSRSGFVLLALAWLATDAIALRHAKAGRFAAHQYWMALNFSLTLAAATLRAGLGIGFALGLAFEDFYAALAWLCWVPNLVVAHALFRGSRAETP